MSKKRICDICNKNEASRSFKIKTQKKGQYEFGSCIHWNGNRWTAWEKIDICGECGEKLMGLPYIDSQGLRRPPIPK